MRGREGGTVDEMRASIWVAEQYRRIGLKPMGEDGTWFQWFDMTRTRVSVTASRASVGGQAMTLFRDCHSAQCRAGRGDGAVLWIPDATDTTADVRGRIVATRVLAPAPGAIPREQLHLRLTLRRRRRERHARSRFARRGAAAVLLVANPAVDSAFEVVSSARSRGTYDVDNAVPRAANGSPRISPPPALGAGPDARVLVHAAMRETLAQAPQAELAIRLERFTTPSVNVIGVVRGTDPKLRDEYVVFSSHQDANGVRTTLEGDSCTRAPTTMRR
jgi:hypothetical protein